MISEYDIEDWDQESQDAYQHWANESDRYDAHGFTELDLSAAWRAAVIWVHGQGTV